MFRPRFPAGGPRLASHASAKKRARQNLKRRARNRHVRTGVKTAVKRARTAIAGDGGEPLDAAMRDAERTIRKAASKGVLSKKQASRKVSRLARSARRARG
jgi:small subunit ribosomal protein S20